MTTTQIPPDLSRESKGAGTRRGPQIRLERILAPVDFATTSDKGIAFTAEVASRFHASVRLLHVVEPLAIPQWGYAYVPMQEAKTRRAASQKLQEIARKSGLRRDALEQTEVRMGNVVPEICAAARENQTDLIVIPAHSHNVLGRLFLGSVAQRVARHASCPVLIARDRTLKQREAVGFQVKRIVVPTDFSEASKKAFPYATALARKFEASITLVYVVPTHLALSLSQLGVILEEKRLTERAREELPRFRAAELDPHLNVSTQVLTGGPTYGICQTAESEAADLIVMGTHGHTGFQRFALGSVTEHVLREAPCPVLVVREKEHDFLVEI
jgi:nucleotide-binding universal stress UspA family protein